MSLFSVAFSSTDESDIEELQVVKSPQQKVSTNYRLVSTGKEDDQFVIDETPAERQPVTVQKEPEAVREVKPKPVLPDFGKKSEIVKKPQIFLLTRRKQLKINGSREFFNFSILGKHHFSAKMKSKSSYFVHISSKTETHLSEQPDYIIIIGNDGRDFSLRQKSVTGKELMTIRFSPSAPPNKLARSCTVSFFFVDPSIPPRLITKQPVLGHDKRLVSDFEGRFSLQSVKNLVLHENADGANVIIARKTGKDALEIESKIAIDPIYLFAISIATCICPIK